MNNIGRHSQQHMSGIEATSIRVGVKRNLDRISAICR